MNTLEKKQSSKTLEKSETINELKELKNILEYLEKMKENENYKPLDQTEIELLESKPTTETIKKAHLYIIAEKIKNIITQNKDKFTLNFKTIIANNKISINCVENLNTFTALKLDTSKQPPILESTIYDNTGINEQIKYLEKKIEEIDKIIEEEKNYKKQETMKFEKTKKNKEEYKPEIDELILPQSKLEKQETKIYLLAYELKNLIKQKEELKEKIKKLEELKEITKNMNFEEFEIIREILKETLGINLKSNVVQKNPIIEEFKYDSKSKIYTIGKKYEIQYIQKIVKTGK